MLESRRCFIKGDTQTNYSLTGLVRAGKEV